MAEVKFKKLEHGMMTAEVTFYVGNTPRNTAIGRLMENTQLIEKINREEELKTPNAARTVGK